MVKLRCEKMARANEGLAILPLSSGTSQNNGNDVHTAIILREKHRWKEQVLLNTVFWVYDFCILRVIYSSICLVFLSFQRFISDLATLHCAPLSPSVHLCST
jgi:hypothetical protein